MDRDALEQIWLQAARGRGHESLDLPYLVSIAKGQGRLTWRDVAVLAARDRTSEVVRPSFLLEFVAEFTRALAPRSILDSWVTAPTLLAAAQEGALADRACGLVHNTKLYEIANATAPLDWRNGDPLLLLDELRSEQFDLLLVSPPIGARVQYGRRAEDPPKKAEFADLVLWRSARHLDASGHVLFHTTDNFLWAESRRGLWDGLAERGLHPHAVVSVDGGFGRATTVASSLVVFGSTARPELFVGRLTRTTPIGALVANLLAGRPADNPALGTLTTPSRFRGWRYLLLERELATLFGSHPIRALGEVGTVRMVNLKPGLSYDVPPNCAFVPAVGFGRVMTSPPDLEGKNAYRLIELQLDPAVARAEYVAALLSSPLGKRLRESVSGGSTIPHLTASAMETLRIPIPSVAVQEAAIRTEAHLASMEATVSRLRSDLWRHPESAQRVVARLENEAKADPVRRWIETLPYPMASVLLRYTAQRDPPLQVERLLHFFQVTAQFGCAVLISILRAVPDLLEIVQSDIANAKPPGREMFVRADFGLWTNLGSTLAKAVRRLADDRDQCGQLAEAAEPVGELMTRFIGKDVWRVLDSARAIRNQRAHAGVVSPDQVAGWLGALEALLSEAEQALANGFEEVDLILPNEARYRSGLHVYSRALRLRGPSDVFDECQVQTREPLESEHLAFVSRDLMTSPALQIVPLVRMGPTASSSRNACYFFESQKGDAFSYISYHFEHQPAMTINDPELQHLAQELAGILVRKVLC